MKKSHHWKGAALLGGLLAALSLFVAEIPDARAEYGDVVINNYSDGCRHAARPSSRTGSTACAFAARSVTPTSASSSRRAGNEINMVKIIDGQFCGACHNGEVAWSVENCNLCHSGKPGTPTQVHESTIQKLAQPVRHGGEEMRGAP